VNGKKARTVRKLWGVKHIHLVPAADRQYLPDVQRERRDGTWGPRLSAEGLRGGGTA
jgi:hypothetical protein